MEIREVSTRDTRVASFTAYLNRSSIKLVPVAVPTGVDIGQGGTFMRWQPVGNMNLTLH